MTGHASYMNDLSKYVSVLFIFLIKSLVFRTHDDFFHIFFRTPAVYNGGVAAAGSPRSIRQLANLLQDSIGTFFGGKLNFSFTKGSPAGRCCNPVTNASPCLDQARDAVSVVRARLAPGAAPRLPATAAEEWRPPLWRRSTRRVLEQIHEHDGSALLVRDGPPARAPVTEERQ